MRFNSLVHAVCGLLGLLVISGVSHPAESADYVTPQTYDALCGNAGHDCTAGFNSMLSAAAAGVKAFLPCGIYETNSGFKIGGAFSGLTLEGSGYCSMLRGTAQVNLLTIGDGSNQNANVKISNIRLTYTASAADSAILMQQTLNSTLQNIWMDGPIYNGLYVKGFGFVSVYNIHVLGCGNDGIIVQGTSSLNSEFYMDPASEVQSCTQNGVHVIGGAGGVRIDGAAIANHVGLLVDGSANREIFLGTDADFDSNQWINVLVQPNAMSPGGYIICTGCWADAAKTNFGIYVNSQGGIHGQFTGAKLNSNSQNPFVWLDTGIVTISGSMIDGNGAAMYFGAGSHVCSGNIGSNAC